MTAEQLQDLNESLVRETATYRHLTVTAELTGRVFDHNAPLPTLPTHRARQEWETQEPEDETP